MNWKRVVLIAIGFGAGFAIFATLIGAGFHWYSNRPKPWNKNALKATFATIEFYTQPQETSYKVEFLYDEQNTTQRNYDFQPANFTILAVLAEGNALPKEFGLRSNNTAVPDRGRNRDSSSSCRSSGRICRRKSRARCRSVTGIFVRDSSHL